jgi:hypothetical protein
MKAAEAYAKWYEEQMGMNTEGYRKLFGPPPSERARSEPSGQRKQPNLVAIRVCGCHHGGRRLVRRRARPILGSTTSACTLLASPHTWRGHTV